jgi:hypothetical protein
LHSKYIWSDPLQPIPYRAVAELRLAECTKEKTVGQSEPQVFSGITPEQYASLIQKARAAGIELSGNSGTASKFDVEVAWNYSPEAQKLTIRCLHTPFLVRPAEVQAKLRKLVQESVG